MNQTLRRVFVMLCAGAGVWILVFWLWEPGGPSVTYGGPPGPPTPGLRGGGNTLAQIDTVAGGPGEDENLDPTLPRPEVDLTTLDSPVAATPDGANPTLLTPVPPPAGAAPGDKSAAAPRVVPPEFWEYTVQRGDSSWETIAEKTLGDRKLASAVLRANPLVSPDKLVPGRTRLKIPRDPKNIQGKVITDPLPAPTAPPTSTPTPAPGVTDPATPAPSEAAPPEAPKPAGVSAPGAQRTHTVGKGDTLSQIAQTYLGSPAKWREIYNVNKGVIPDPDHLKLGTVLKIPAEKPKP